MKKILKKTSEGSFRHQNKILKYHKTNTTTTISQQSQQQQKPRKEWEKNSRLAINLNKGSIQKIFRRWNKIKLNLKTERP